MLSDFQKEKISHYFRVVLDQDRNGILEENDFREIGESLCVLWVYKPGTKEYNEVIDKNVQSWNMFKKYFQKQGAEANEEQSTDEEERVHSRPKGKGRGRGKRGKGKGAKGSNQPKGRGQGRGAPSQHEEHT